MCTLTWLPLPGGYEVHFNRDESRARKTAIPPQIHSSNQIQFICPTDADAGGTWASVNDKGISLCLLNNYIEIKNTDAEVSRGQLVKNLAATESFEEIGRRLNDLDVLVYKPFNLFVFDSSGNAQRYNWNGKDFETSEPSERFMSSSGFEPELAISHRRKTYLNIQNPSSNHLAALHRSHEPSRSSYSTCMHRTDARTQSYSRISVTEENCQYWYTDGPPCTAPIGAPIDIQRI